MTVTDKDFRVKNGLVVEGDHVIVNGDRALTSTSLDHGGHTGLSVSYNENTNEISLTAAGGGMTLYSSDPLTAQNGDIYFNTSTLQLKIYYNTWLVLSTADTNPGTPSTTQWSAIYDGGTPSDTTVQFIDGGTPV